MDDAPVDAAEMDAYLETAGGASTATLTPCVEDLLRELAPQVLGVLARRYGDFDAAEDAVQEALSRPPTHWPRDGIPDNPRGWLIQTADAPADRPVAQRPAARRREVDRARCASRSPRGRRPPSERRHAHRCCSCAATRR